MTKAFIDSCVLILAAKAQEDDVVRRAMEELNRDDVTYLYSTLVQMEVLPSPRRNNRQDEQAFMEAYFASAEKVECGEAAQEHALNLMFSVAGLLPVDAMHLSAATLGGASEFVNAEGGTKPMNNVGDQLPITVRTIRGG